MSQFEAPEPEQQPFSDAKVASTSNASGQCTDNRKRDLEKRDKDPSAEGASVTTAPLEAVIEFGELSRPTSGTRSRIGEGSEEAEERFETMRRAIRTLLECIGEDPDREGLLATPARCAKSLLFLTKGYQINIDQLVNNALFHEGHSGMVVVKDIDIHSLCEHHLLPFTGKMHIGYIPSDIVIGLSKLPRIAEMFSQRLQIQERLTKEVANAIAGILNPQGVAVFVESGHLCMMMRGIKKTGSTTITTCFLGSFEDKPEMRNEFLSLISTNRK